MKRAIAGVNLLRLGILSLLILSFQNCSPMKFSENLTTLDAANGVGLPSTGGGIAPTTCSFNGVTYNEGGTITAYRQSSVANGQTCESETRVCTGGAFTGSFAYASCGVGQPAACLFDGKTIPHGQTVSAYQSSAVPYGEGCRVELRACNNGSLSGTYGFSSCEIGAPASCIFNGKTVAHGRTVIAYAAANVPYGQTCSQQVRACTNGNLSGNYQHETCVPLTTMCTPNTTQSCSSFPNAAIHPGTGLQTCNSTGTAWGACLRQSCSAISGIQEGNCVGSVPTVAVNTNLGNISTRFSNGAQVWDVKCEQDGWKWQYTCPAQKNICQAVRQTLNSPDGSNSCTFVTSGTYSGTTISVPDEQGHGGTANATCTDTGWQWQATCPNSNSNVAVCPAGELNEVGASGKRYYFGWGQGTAGETRTIYSYYDTAAYGTFRCGADGRWIMLSATLP